MGKEILDTAHHRPSEIRYLVIRFQAAQLPLQKAGNHPQKLQNRLQILLRRRGFLSQVGKQILRRVRCFGNGRIAHHCRRALDAVHRAVQAVDLLRRHLKFLCICLGFNKSINFIYIFPRFLQKKLLQEIRIFNKPLHLIILLS